MAATVVVGHSIGANVALEMAASGAFSGPLVLLAPSFSRQDESRFPRVLDRLARVLGHLPFAAMLKFIGLAVKESPLPPQRLAELAAELRQNDPRVIRRVSTRLPRVPGPPRLGRRATVPGRGARLGRPRRERRRRHAPPPSAAPSRRASRSRLITIPGPSFFTANEEPALVAGLVTEAIAALAGRRAEER